MPYTDDAYVLIRNHPLFVASEQLQYPDHVQQPFNTFLRDACIWTSLIVLGKHPQYFYAKLNVNMTLDSNLCENVSRILIATNDSEALKTTTYKNLKFTLFPRIFRTIDYFLEISAFILTFIYIFDSNDWQDPLIFRCPLQYQIGSMGLLLAWLTLLSYFKRST
ncbi:unnamed protein product, partial [Adineta ricciae]